VAATISIVPSNMDDRGGEQRGGRLDSSQRTRALAVHHRLVDVAIARHRERISRQLPLNDMEDVIDSNHTHQPPTDRPAAEIAIFESAARRFPDPYRPGSAISRSRINSDPTWAGAAGQRAAANRVMRGVHVDFPERWSLRCSRRNRPPPSPAPFRHSDDHADQAPGGFFRIDSALSIARSSSSIASKPPAGRSLQILDQRDGVVGINSAIPAT
jgi:hypothetical protein